MDRITYQEERARLLRLAAWHGWADRRGYKPNAGDAHRGNQRDLARLRANQQTWRAAA